MTIGKQLTLNFNGLGAVAHYVTTFNTPMQLTNAQIEIPTAYLLPNFNTYFTYNAETQQLSNVTPALQTCSSSSNYGFTADFGGVIISDASQSNAMGVYGVSTGAGGSVSYYTLWNITCQGSSKWDAVFGPGTIPSGANSYSTYVITGTVNEVTSLMNQLYSQGVR